MSLMFFFLWFVLFLFVMRQKKEMNKELENAFRMTLFYSSI